MISSKMIEATGDHLREWFSCPKPFLPSRFCYVNTEFPNAHAVIVVIYVVVFRDLLLSPLCVAIRYLISSHCITLYVLFISLSGVIYVFVCLSFIQPRPPSLNIGIENKVDLIIYDRSGDSLSYSTKPSIQDGLGEQHKQHHGI